ncbi:hypothetical protein SAMN06265220_101690 [Flavobacterium nitrogenifigens]|uniref:Uncharacterized protein n=1 Tax=Flavobacterium nitrogenifigens TaxID=1617283 RepID=A0A521B692_9FLAO|nr:hypothetical protein SAMN06265220_101690 [Flavobacterium nitrogenifigens]
MSRLKRLQSIDSLRNVLVSIATNQCSLSENEINYLNDAIAKLNRLRTKKGLTDKHYKSEITDIVSLITKFLI